MLITDECVGLASIPDCANARIACAKAVELFDAAKLPADDKQRVAVRLAATSSCPKFLHGRPTNVPPGTY